MDIQFYTNTGVLKGAPVFIEDDAQWAKKINGDNNISFSFTTNLSPATWQPSIMDYIIFNGEHYTINQPPKIIEVSLNSYKYQVKVEAYQYDLGKVQYMFYDDTIELTGTFSLMGNADTFIDLLITNLNRMYTGGAAFTKGTVLSGTTFRALDFDSENCLAVLNKLCDEFATEYYFTGKQINFIARSNATGLTFKYGYNKGAYQLERNTVSSTNIVTRLYAFGSERNIPYNYPVAGPPYSSRLRFTDIDDKHIIEDSAVVAAYGVIEATKNFDDIYPQFEGVVSAINLGNILKFTDSGIDFNVNTYLISGLQPTIAFLTGDLAGYALKISAFNNATKEFTIIADTSLKSYIMPNNTLMIAVGDTYTILDISMPGIYITNAETRLYDAALAYYNLNINPPVSYTLTSDKIYFEEENIALDCGDLVHIISAIGLDDDIRITGFTKKLKNLYDGTFELADTVYDPYKLAKRNLRQTQLIKNINDNLQWQANSVNAAALDYAAALAAANAANALLADIASDNKLTASEKKSIRKEWNTIASEKSALDTQADNFSITTEKTTYNTKFQALATYLNDGVTWTSGIPTWITDANLGNTTDIVGATFRDYFKQYYDAKLALINAIETKAKTLANTGIANAATAQAKADSAYSDANNAATAASNAYNLAATKRINFNTQPTTPYTIGDTWTDGANLWTCTTSRSSGAFNAADWAKRTVYDSTQTTIDGGIVTAGSLRVMDGSNVEWGGMKGGGANTEIGLWLGASYANRATAPFYVSYSGAMFATAGSIAGWTIVSNALYKDTGYAATSAGMCPGDYPFYAGATFANRASAPFRVAVDGSVTVQSGISGKRIIISSANNNMIFYSDTDTNYLKIDNDMTDSPAIWIYGHPNGLSSLNFMSSEKIGVTAGSIYFSAQVGTSALTVLMKGLPQYTGGSSTMKNLNVDTATGELKWS